MIESTVKKLGKYGGKGHLQGIIIIGLVLGLSVGFLDIALSISSGPSGFSSFSFILLPLVATISVFFLLYLLIWFFVGSQLTRLPRVEFFPLAVSVAFFLGTIFILASLNDLMHFSLSSTQVFKLFILFFISLTLSIGTYFTARSFVHLSDYRNAAAIFSIAIPFLLAEMVAFIWLQKYRIGLFVSVPSLIVSGIYILTTLFTIWLLYRTARKIRIARLLAILTTVVILSPLVPFVATKVSPASLVEFGDTDHRVKRVILIIVDTLRPDFVSCYGCQSLSTPHIDQLGRDGILFTKAISAAPWTLPSVASVMTGLSPSVHMTIGRGSKLQDSFRTLAEYMLDAGYFTAAIGSNPFLTSRRNISQGFIEYNFFPKPSIGKSFGARLLKRIVPSRFRAEVSTHDLTKLACHWIEENYEKDFFLWIHYYDPHLPYSPPPDFIEKLPPSPAIGTSFSKLEAVRGGYFVPSLAEKDWIRELYGSEVRYVDKSLGSLLDTLKRLNLYEESLIILTSDHGEEFWEHSGFEHGHTLYNEVLWVPLMIKPPLYGSKKLAKKVVSQVITTASITPTILDICKIGYEKEFLCAPPLSPLWELNSDAFKPGPIISTGLLYYEDKESIIFDGLKYIRSLMTNHEELYDLASDPKERNCIASLFPDKTQRIGYILREHKGITKKLRKHYGIFKKETIEVDRETIERLKSLGYVQ